MKSKKFLSIFFLVVVLTTLFVPLFSFNTSAVDVHEYKSGEYLVWDNTIEVLNFSEQRHIIYLDFYAPLLEESFVGFVISKDVYSGNSKFLGYLRSDGTEKGVYRDVPREDNSGWVDGNCRIIQFQQDVTEKILNVWFDLWGVQGDSNTVEVFDSAYQTGYDIGYNVGFVRGRNEGQSEDFGFNFLGDTLSAPIRALDNLVLFESNSGFRITVWGVFSTVVGISLFIWFMKMFAGG